MNYFKCQVRRVYKNRMILYGILTAYFLIIPASLFASKGSVGTAPMLVMAGIFTLVPVLFLIGFISSCIKHSNYTLSRQYKRLGQLGMGSPEDVSRMVDHEIESFLVLSQKTIKVTANWVCFQTAFNIQVRPISHLIWIYKLITRSNIATYYSVVFTFIDRRQIKFISTEAQCSNLMAFISQNNPHVLTGYTKYWDDLYRNNFNEFMNVVKQSSRA